MKPLTSCLLPVLLLLMFMLQTGSTPDKRQVFENHLLTISADRAHAKGALDPKSAVDHPEMAAFQDYLMTFDPTTGLVPSGRLYPAWNSYLMRTHKSTSMQWQEFPSDAGGRMRAIAWDPGDSTGRRLFAGAATGGLWVNQNIHNQASPWAPVPGFPEYLAVSSIAFDPKDPDIIYVGTGESQTALITYRASSGKGVGIFKSTDGGLSWSLLPSTQSFAYVSDVVVRNENNLSVIYAGVVSGIYMGVTHNSLPSEGLFRSDDGGLTWQQVLPDIGGPAIRPYPVSDIELSADGRIFVGTQKDMNGYGGACILHSDSGLTGTWTLYNGLEFLIAGDPTYDIPGRIVLAAAPSDPSVIYAACGAGYYNSSGFNLSRGRYIVRTNDKGQTWSQRALPQPSGGGEWATLAWHALTLGVDPNNPQALFAGGLDQHRSNNNALTWVHLSDWGGMYSGGGSDYIHADQHKVLYYPGSSDTIVFATDGGIFYTSDATAAMPAFFEHSKGLNTLQFYTCAIHPHAGNDSVLGGLQDNGTFLGMSNSFNIMSLISGGDGAYCFFDEDQPSLFYTSVYYNGYRIFLNGSYFDETYTYGSGIFINPAAYYSDGNVIFANATTFNGQNADQLLRITGLPYFPTSQFLNLNTGVQVPFTHVGVSPESTPSNIQLFAGSESGRLFLVTDAGTTPQVQDIGSAQFPTGAISSVAAGSSNDTLLTCFSNYGVPSLWYTTNGGNSWIDVEGNLPDMPVRWALLAPGMARQSVIATEMGVWTCEDLLATPPQWQAAGTGMPAMRTDMLRFRASDSTILAATHGRGFWKVKWDLGGPSGIELPPASAVSVYPNPASVDITVEGTMPGQTISLFDMAGKEVMKKKVDESQVRLDLSSHPKGYYLVEVDGQGMRTVHKVILE